MISNRRSRQHQLVQALQERKASFEVQHMLELLGLLLEETKDNLTTCAPGEVARMQGEAQTYDKLIRQITRNTVMSAVQE